MVSGMGRPELYWSRQKVRLTSPSSVLRTNRNFRLVYFGQAISQLGDWFNAVAVYALLLDLTGSARAVALMLIVQMLPFAMVILVLVIFGRGSMLPPALGLPYIRGER